MKKHLFSFLLSLAIVSSATADYLQSPGHFGGFGSDGGVITVADDFQFTQDTVIGRLHWWGGYFNPPPGPDNFIIQLFADNGGQPGSVLSDFSLGSVAKFSTGNYLNPGLYPEFRYSAELLSPFQAQANVRYWLSIINPPRDIWLWEVSASPVNVGVQRSRDGGATWQPYFDNTAFEVVAIPEPNVALLLMGGIIATLVRNKRCVG
jgi:hypothetical protein